MAYDPDLPAPDSEINSAELRSQFGGLADQIATKASMADVTSAISSTAARNCDAVEQMNIAFHDPISRAEGEALQAKYNELVAALHS